MASSGVELTRLVTDNGAFNRGNDQGVFLHRDEDTLYRGMSPPLEIVLSLTRQAPSGPV